MRMLWNMVVTIFVWMVFGFLAWAMVAIPRDGSGLTAESMAKLEESGVKNPVTAVLLNYRGYDTLLEVAVLLLAIVGVWSLSRTTIARQPRPAPELLMAMLRVVLPVLVVGAGYLLWIGAFAPGGAFQGGALLGGALVLAFLGGLGGSWLARAGWVRFGLVIGLTVFAAVAAGVMMVSGGLLQYPVANAKNWILLVESAAMVSIGLTLGLLFLGGRPVVEDQIRNPKSEIRNKSELGNGNGVGTERGATS